MTEPQQPDLPFSIKKINVSSEGKRKLIGEWKIEPPIFPPIDFSDETVEFIKDEFLEELKEYLPDDAGYPETGYSIDAYEYGQREYKDFIMRNLK